MYRYTHIRLCVYMYGCRYDMYIYRGKFIYAYKYLHGVICSNDLLFSSLDEARFYVLKLRKYILLLIFYAGSLG